MLESAVAYLKFADESVGGATIELLENDSPLHVDMGNGMYCFYLMDGGGQYVYVTNGMLRDADITKEELHKIGIANLWKTTQERFEVVKNNNIYGVITGGTFESSLVFLKELWPDMLGQLNIDSCVVVIPARDICAFAPSDSEVGIKELNELVERVFTTGHPDHTKTLFKYTENGWIPFA